ncbi:MAG: lipase maturation factor family protein [Pseudomonadales bacterium]
MRPRLIYDGDCGFCRYTVGYAAAVTGEAVVYLPFQQVAGEYPDIPLEAFQASIQLIDYSGRTSGAAAAFRVLELGGRRAWMRLYRRLPGFAWLCERLYAWVARHRAACLRLARLLVGPKLIPARHERVAGWMGRGIGLCSLAAFVSLWWQVQGLIGPDGVLPARSFLDAVAAGTGGERFYWLPTLLWIDAGSASLHLLCAVGAAAALVGVLGRWSTTSALIQYGCYLSLLHAGQVFLSYQWDTLLLECLVLAALLGRAPGAGVWAARALLLRFLFLSGYVKLASSDPSWWSGTALDYHFLTQPLPTVLAWYAAQLPEVLLRTASYATLFIELVLALFVIGPRRLRLVALPAIVLLEGLIFLTGNYNFFNLLTLVLCLCLLDDADLPRRLKRPRRMKRPRLIVRPRRVSSTGARCCAGVLITLGALQMANQLGVAVARPLLVYAQPWAVVNPYGLFAVMTTRRDELIIEGSLDGETWVPYEFPFQPGDVMRRPVWATPHQPRLDWQMWFAALNGPAHADWIYDLLGALLEASPAVLRLVEDPLDGARPAMLRVVAYRYRFASPDVRRDSGAWWVRDQRREWLPPTRLRRPSIRHEPLTLD